MTEFEPVVYRSFAGFFDRRFSRMFTRLLQVTRRKISLENLRWRHKRCIKDGRGEFQPAN
jgi:hypothetical protein